MPLVRVRNWMLPQDEVRRLIKELPRIVSEALHIEELEDAHLTPEDIEVNYEPGRPEDIHGYHNNMEAAISVEAMYFPERAERVQDATAKMKEEVLNIIPGHWVIIWVTLPVAGFEEIQVHERPAQEQASA